MIRNSSEDGSGHGAQASMGVGCNLADFLVICVGRVGTNSITNALQDHPQINHVFANNSCQALVREERERNPSARIGIIGHHFQDFDGPEGLPKIADATTRQTLIHVVRDPLPHICARYNQLAWNEAYATAYAEHVLGPSDIGPPQSIRFELPDFDTFARHSDWIDVQYHSYRQRFGRFEKSLTIDFEELRPGTTFANTFRSIFGALGVRNHLNSWISDLPSGSRIIHSLVRTPLGKAALELCVEELDVNGWVLLVPNTLDPLFDSTFQFLDRKGKGLVVELPGFLDAVGAPLVNHHLCLIISSASKITSENDFPAFVLETARRYVEECWAPDWIRLLNRAQSLFDIRKVEEIPQSTEEHLRALFAKDVERMYQEHPQLEMAWTF